MPVSRALFKAALPGWAKLGWSGARMISEARRLAFPVGRYKWAYDDIRQAKERYFFTPKVRAFTKAELVPRGLMVHTQFPRPRKYRVFVSSIEPHPITGETIERQRCFYTNTLRSKEGYLDDFDAMMEETEEYRGIEIFSREVTIIEHDRRMGY